MWPPNLAPPYRIRGGGIPAGYFRETNSGRCCSNYHAITAFTYASIDQMSPGSIFFILRLKRHSLCLQQGEHVSVSIWQRQRIKPVALKKWKCGPTRVHAPCINYGLICIYPLIRALIKKKQNKQALNKSVTSSNEKAVRVFVQVPVSAPHKHLEINVEINRT